MQEIDFIQKCQQIFKTKRPETILGIGDDGAVLDISGSGIKSIFSKDLLVEDIHFYWKPEYAKLLGRKALAVNISDIAAMGGLPTHALLGIAIPDHVKGEALNDLIVGINEQAEEYNIHIIGGDTSRSPDKLFISITIIGSVLDENISYRSSAKTGDIIYLTGQVGLSSLGLAAYEEKIELSVGANDLVFQAHFNPKPHLKEGLFLTKLPAVHSLIDISDGIGNDIYQIMEASKVGAFIELAQIDPDQQIYELHNQIISKPYDYWLLDGGEDYVLMLTVDHFFAAEVEQQFLKEFQRPLIRIGEINKDSGILMVNYGSGRIKERLRGGYQHPLGNV